MKKFFTGVDYKSFNQKRSEDRNIRRLAHKKWKTTKLRLELGLAQEEIKEKKSFKNKYPNYVKVIAPEVFSFIKNTNEVIELIEHLKKLYDSNQKVYVVLEHVKETDYSAIVVLLSIMVKFKTKNIDFNGSIPSENEPRQMLEQSGFFKNLYKKFTEHDSYDISTIGPNGIHTHAAKKVDSALSSQIITSATKYIWGEARRCQGVQRVLIELMQNTNNHAEIGKLGEKHWWLSVNQDKNSKKVSFSFVDFGVGIFTNLAYKPTESKFYGWVQKLSSKIQYGNNADLLELILKGELHRTVTGEHYRGKGLPGIAEVMRRNQISNLHIITNDVFCCASNGIYRTLSNSFSGTFVYWELGEDNDSHKRVNTSSID
ncbi:MAG: hypothetical protein H6936_11360 [Burkholderiales bacterium]|nr:hypothetical protein [Burkholderiales bacterium]